MTINHGKLGFIGAGFMAEAFIRGLLDAGVIDADSVMASDVSDERRNAIAHKYKIAVTANNEDVFQFANTVIVAVKPQHAATALQAANRAIKDDHLIVSIMAGLSTREIASMCKKDDLPVVRIMPNVAAVVGQAALAVSWGDSVGQQHQEAVQALISPVGQVITVDEPLMDAVTGLSGSGPAYVMTVIESLVDGGVAEGLPAHIAHKLAIQTVLGAAELLKVTDEHPAVWRERVTSPAGTTAEGLAVLEQRAVRSAFSEAVRAASRRSKALKTPGKGN